ncbi:MAG TPA: ATP-dependent DNA ligase, partial [Acidobacteriota bacterium]
MRLPLKPPIDPMLALLVKEIPEGPDWQYEMKVDGFRAIVFWDGKELFIQSRDLKPLNRYFPELENGLKKVLPPGIVVDGEIVIEGPKGLDFDALLLRIHPAASRVQKLAKETPASFIAFDLLAAKGKNLMNEPLKKRRNELEKLLARSAAPVYIAPATAEAQTARKWFTRFEGAGLDGIVAKRLNEPYLPGERAMMKIKHQRTIDCVVGGFRWNKGEKHIAVGSLLLGLYQGRILHYVGHASNFTKPQRRELVELLSKYRDADESKGFGKGRTPGGISRWSQGKDTSWEPLRPELVCEISFDHLQGDRFRHAATFKRWRFDKPPRQCTFDQIKSPKPFAFQKVVAPASTPAK